MLKMDKITSSNSELHSPEDLENTKIVDNPAVLWITTVIRIKWKNRFGIALTLKQALFRNCIHPDFGIALTSFRNCTHRKTPSNPLWQKKNAVC